MLIAYVDESARRRQGEDVCVYTLAAVLVETEHVTEVRETMQSLRYGKSRTFHWRMERAARRAVLTEALAQLPVVGVVTVCLHRADMRSERARRRCLVRLLTELSARGVDRVIFESRNEQDATDRAVLTSLRTASAVSADMQWPGHLPSPIPACGRRTVSRARCRRGSTARAGISRSWHR